MFLQVVKDPIPLAITDDGIVRVGSTRITLDTVVGAFLDGATAELIVEQYPSLHLTDAYTAIVRAENEARFNPAGVRARLWHGRSRASTRCCA